MRISRTSRQLQALLTSLRVRRLVLAETIGAVACTVLPGIQEIHESACLLEQLRDDLLKPLNYHGIGRGRALLLADHMVRGINELRLYATGWNSSALGTNKMRSTTLMGPPFHHQNNEFGK